MSSPNIILRDPVMYRILHAEHHRTGKDFLRVAALVLALATGLTLGLAQQSKEFRGSAEAVAVSTGASESEQLLLSDR